MIIVIHSVHEEILGSGNSYLLYHFFWYFPSHIFEIIMFSLYSFKNLICSIIAIITCRTLYLVK